MRFEVTTIINIYENKTIINKQYEMVINAK
jgi:hypothetical protein